MFDLSAESWGKIEVVVFELADCSGRMLGGALECHKSYFFNKLHILKKIDYALGVYTKLHHLHFFETPFRATECSFYHGKACPKDIDLDEWYAAADKKKGSLFTGLPVYLSFCPSVLSSHNYIKWNHV